MSELMCSQSKCRRKDEHIAELKTRELGFIQSLRELWAENAELREAAQALYDSKFKDPKTGNQCVAFCELEKMAALLQERGE